MNQIRIKDTAYLVSRRSSEQKAGDKPSVIFCSGNRKLSERAKGTVPDKASDSSAYLTVLWNRARLHSRILGTSMHVSL